MPIIYAFIAWLSPFLTALFVSFFTYAAQFLARKSALYFAAMALFAALLAAFVVFVNGLILSLFYAVPAELSTAFGWFAPSNVSVCASAYISMQSAKYIYDLNYKFLFKGHAMLGSR